jgi:NADP-dependent 3-hydroxy acid dehydrogenase YdfG
MELPAPLVDDVLGWLPGRLGDAPALVRGADCPQGEAVVRALLRRGLRVAAWGSRRASLAALEAAADSRRLLVLSGSARPDATETLEALARTAAHLGPVEIFVDALDGRPGPDAAALSHGLELLVAATAAASRVVARDMIAGGRRGTVCVVGGLDGRGHAAEATAWNAIHAARAAMTRNLRRELDGDGVRVALVERGGCFGLDIGEAWTAAAVVISLELALEEVSWPLGAGLWHALSERTPWPLSPLLALAASRPLPGFPSADAQADPPPSRRTRAPRATAAPAPAPVRETTRPATVAAQATEVPPPAKPDVAASPPDAEEPSDADGDGGADALGSNAEAVRDLAARAAALGRGLRKPRPGGR